MTSEYKIVVLGSGGVGKSTYVVQFIQGVFVEEYDPTIEDSYRRQNMIDDEPALLDILDTAGQDEWTYFRDTYYRTGQGFCFVYSITDRGSFNDILTLYEQVLRVKDADSVPCVLIANKSDLAREQREVAYSEGEELAKRLNNAPFFELTARDRTNVEESMYEMVRQIRNTSTIDVSKWERMYKKTFFLNFKKKKELKAKIKKLKNLSEIRELKKQLVIVEKQLNGLKSPDGCPEVTVMDQCDVAEQFEKMSFLPKMVQLYIETARNSATGDVKAMINDKTTADVIVSVPFANDEKREPMLFYVHKDILKSRCGYFAGMFNHRFWKENQVTSSENSTTSTTTTTTTSRTLPICNMKDTTRNPVVFEALLEFIYTDSVAALETGTRRGQTLNLDDVAELMVLSNEFQLPRLKQLCERQLAKQCTFSFGVDKQVLLDCLAGAQMHLCSQLAAVCIYQLSVPEMYQSVSTKKRYRKVVEENEKRLIKEKYDAIVADREQRTSLTKQIDDLKCKIQWM